MVQDQSVAERQFQEDTVRNLTGHYDNIKSWSAPESLDGTKHHVTYQTLIDNWRNIINQQNTKELEGLNLTDEEFSQVMTRVNGLSNSYDAATLLAQENAVGKIDNIIRNASGATKHNITLKIFQKAQVNGGDSVYQIAREVWTEGDQNRFDILLLINGLPLINIEQKRLDKTIDEAFGQFKRYYKDGEYTNNFFAFSQMMVVMTDLDTRYFATPKNYDAFNKAFLFRWADANNRPITSMREITKTLLRIPMAHQMVGDYLVIDENVDRTKSRHMLMRPYQVEALRRIEFAANGYDNPEHIAHGGYIWHTTGSGKTITSFKAATSLSKSFEKVIFLVDRKDLDSQTSKNFKAYAAYDSIEVDDSPYTDSLRGKLQSKIKGVVVATTFKMNNVVQDLLNNGDVFGILDKHMAVIVDEAHRTTMGSMMLTIRQALHNTLFFGFTGTPLFDENHIQGVINDKSEHLQTTEQMFGPELHRYTIDEAIKDRNVLGFHVNYINTGEFQSYSDLAQRWVTIQKAKSNNQLTDDRLQLKALELEGNRTKDKQGIIDGRAKLEREVLYSAGARNIPEAAICYQDETHIPTVVSKILDDWKKQSKGLRNGTLIPYKFNAILTVARIDRVVTYYQEFKRQLAQRNMTLNITATFSQGAENTKAGAASKESLQEIFDDWHTMGHPQYYVEAKKANQGEQGFFSDITTLIPNGGHGLNSKNIDLVIVADRLLTGFDSKLTNTLYVDRQLKLQGLIQAYSRTNRVYGPDKEFGSIINFMYPAKTRYSLETALYLYGSGGTNSQVIMPEYTDVIHELEPAYAQLQQTLLNPEQWATLQDRDEPTLDFMNAYKSVSKQLNHLSQYYEFDWQGVGDKQLPLTEETWLKYQGAYRNLKPKDSDDDDDEIVQIGEAHLADTQDITFDEIIRLIGKAIDQQNNDGELNEENIRLINEQIMKLRSFGDKDNAEMLKDFMSEIVDQGQLSATDSVDESYHRYVVSKGNHELRGFAKQWGIKPDILSKVYDGFNVNSETINYLDELRDTSSYKDSQWYADLEQHSLLDALRYKNELDSEVRKWLHRTKPIYKNLD